MTDPKPPVFTGPELCSLEAHEAVALLKAGKVSARDLLDAALSRIATVEPEINALPTVCGARAYRAVDALNLHYADHPGWLGGLPLGIKDLDRVKGVRTTFGTPGLADYVPDFSDHFVERLEDRGGVVVGKTNTPEFGAGGNTFNPVHGTTRNPWNTAMNAAGSSGGAAASLATGETWLSQGSDHGGSLRTPATYCGVVGLRPVPGRIATTQTPGFSSGWITEGVIGPMARSVRDAALFLDALSGFEPAMPFSLHEPRASFQQAVIEASPKVRIAFAPDLKGFGAVEPVIRDAMSDALSKVEASGGAVVEACPDVGGLDNTYRRMRGLGMAPAYANLPDEIFAQVKETLRENVAYANTMTLQDFNAVNVDRTRIFLSVQQFLQDFDVLACATVGAMPRPVEVEWIDQIKHERYDDYLGWLRFAFLATTTGLPAASVPIGVSSEGMPIGLQLIGPPQGEAKVLAVARAVEIAVGGPFAPIDPVVRHT
ncbi:amidase [Rhodobacteraceae bacterium]|nr:amidase [Paracoccaceae bacterium]